MPVNLNFLHHFRSSKVDRSHGGSLFRDPHQEILYLPDHAPWTPKLVIFRGNKSDGPGLQGSLRQGQKPCQYPKKSETYLVAVKIIIKANIHLITLAGTNFWQRAPRYIPAIPPTPNMIPRSQSGATDIFG
jgi:hypothetical protein